MYYKPSQGTFFNLIQLISTNHWYILDDYHNTVVAGSGVT